MFMHIFALFTSTLWLGKLLTVLCRRTANKPCMTLYNKHELSQEVQSDNDHSYFIPEGASRSPCPALNTLANHGYLPRHGTKIHPMQLIRALHHGYNLSYPFAAFLTLGGFVAMGQFSDMSLGDLCRHNHVEHNASLAHDDAQEWQEYAPSGCNRTMFEKLCTFSSDGKYLSVSDWARARVSREREDPWSIDPIHSEIARGEVALVAGIFGGPKQMVPVEIVRQWWKDETFPKGWKPEHKQTLWKTIRTAWSIKSGMNEI
ncbi:Cloroperoxidase, partial [Heliocybe sulcata]